MFQTNIKLTSLENSSFRKVLYSGPNCQIVVMNLKPGEEIGEETHAATDQILVLVDGSGELIINDEKRPFNKYDLVYVPAGTKHNFINSGETEMKLYTVYSPPEHPDQLEQKNKPT